MFQSTHSDATASPASATCAISPAPSDPPSPQYTTVRPMLFGTPLAVHTTIKHLYKLNYAESNDWTKPVPTGQPSEVVAVLVKKIRVV